MPTYTTEDGRIFPIQRFGSILRAWAKESAKQLKDSYKLQKIWTGDKADEVWSARTIEREVPKYDSKGNKVGTRKVKVKQKGWYEESKKREERARKYNNPNYWYSTGETYDLLAVNVVNQTITDGQVDFRTTTAALFAEAGAGLNGPKFTRGRRGSKGRKRIKVDRAEPYSHSSRYVKAGWIPGRGYAHRPSTRQQVNLLKRRLKWAAKKIFLYDLTVYLAASFEVDFSQINMAIDAMPGKPKYKVVARNIAGAKKIKGEYTTMKK